MDQNKDNNMQQEFRCTGDCINCRKQPGERREQWQYCAAQFTYNSLKVLNNMQEQMMAMQDTIDSLADRIEAIQNSEASVFDPTAADARTAIQNQPGTSVIPTDHTIAQEGAGVV